MSSTGIQQQQLDTAKAPQLDKTKSIQDVKHGLKANYGHVSDCIQRTHESLLLRRTGAQTSN